jgi:hypothetical protein
MRKGTAPRKAPKRAAKAPITGLRGYWPSYEDGDAQLDLWQKDRGCFDDGEGREWMAKRVQAMMADEGVAEAWIGIQERALREAIEGRQIEAVEELLRESAPPELKKRRAKLIGELIEERRTLLREQGWGDESGLSVAFFSSWGNESIKGLGADWAKIGVKLARLGYELHEAARRDKAPKAERLAARDAARHWLVIVASPTWSAEEALEIETAARAEGEEPFWIKQWRTVAAESSHSLELVARFRPLAKEDIGRQRRELSKGYWGDADDDMANLAFKVAREMPLAKARALLCEMVSERKKDPGAMIARAFAARPGWIAPRHAAGLVANWLASFDDWNVGGEWGSWKSQVVREMCEAIEAGCGQPIDWGAPAFSGFETRWGASDVRGPKGPPASFSANFKGRRLTLVQAAWIEGNRGALDFWAKKGCLFDHAQAKSLLDMMGESSMPIEFMGPFSTPLQRIVSEHEAQAMRAEVGLSKASDSSSGSGAASDGRSGRRRL